MSNHGEPLTVPVPHRPDHATPTPRRRQGQRLFVAAAAWLVVATIGTASWWWWFHWRESDRPIDLDTLPGQILFGSTRSEANPSRCDPCNVDLYVMAANGSSPRQLTDTPQPDFRGYVTVAGNTVVYPTRGENGDRLIELSLEDGSRRVIARSAGSLFHPTQSPLDGPILVGVQRGERRSLIGMVADVGPGKGTVVPITDPPPGQVDGSPSWASSGSDVAFIRSDRETGDGAIVILSYMSGDETEVLRVDHPSSVAWSPDGGRLVYSARGPSGDLDLYVLDLETMKIIPLVERAGDDDLPAWSPDGRFVAFNHVDGDTIAVFVVRDDGTGIVRLPTGSDHDAAPVWFAPSE